MIFRGSRYEKATQVRVKQADKSSAMAVYADRRIGIVPVDWVQYTVVAGDRLDVLAASAYGDPQLWWVLARANPEVFYPDDIPPGTILRIPSAAAIR